jgi:nucleoside-diphosphate-sugar epimerase
MLSLKKAVILGATGPTGIHLARELLAKGLAVRVVARHAEGLARCFANQNVECLPADILEAAATRRAIEGCDVVFDCIGLPAERMRDHPATARTIADAISHTGARCVQVSSYWAYLPVVSLPLNEQHPRSGGVFYVQTRREAEDILCRAGAAIVNLPDFFGPGVHASTLQQALAEAAAGTTMNWIGSVSVTREYVYVPDAMRAVARLAEHEAAYGERWIVPGAGPLTGQGVAEIAGRHLNRTVKVRAAGLWTLRLVSLFSRPLRQFLPMAPYYLQPISYDGGKLETLIGAIETTPYDDAIGKTLDGLRGGSAETAGAGR